MILVLSIIGPLLIMLGWHIGTRPASGQHDESSADDVIEGAVALLCIFVGIVFLVIAGIAAGYRVLT